MKLASRDQWSFFNKPDPGACAILIYGGDASRIAQARKTLIGAIIGPQGEAEMRLEHISSADLRDAPSALSDATKMQGFFQGNRVVLFEGATDQNLKPIENAISNWEKGDAQIIIIARELKPSSKLRKLFETGKTLIAAPIYADPPSREEVEAKLSKSGLSFEPDARNALFQIANTLDPQRFDRFIEKVSLYKFKDNTPLNLTDLEINSALTDDTDKNEVIMLVADGQIAKAAQKLESLFTQGVNPTELVIAATQYFRQLYIASISPSGPDAALSHARPPVFGPKKRAMVAQVSAWGTQRLETALQLLNDTDLTLRSSPKAPRHVILERVFIRLSMLRSK